MTDLVIRTMLRTELDLGIDWAAAEGWNPGLHDADAFHAADPQGYFVGLLDDEPIGMIAAVRYGEGFGFIGFYIVRPAWRGRGHGLALWQAGMQSLSGRLVGLDGVVAQQANYQRSGFELAYNNIRHQGTAMAAGSPDPQIVPISQIPFEQVVRYDAALFPDDRRSFLKAWLSLPGSIGLALMQGERLAGFGAIRPAGVQGRAAAGRRRRCRRATAARLAGGRAERRPGAVRYASGQCEGHRSGPLAGNEPGLRDRPHVYRRRTAAAPRAALRRHQLRTRLTARCPLSCAIQPPASPTRLMP